MWLNAYERFRNSIKEAGGNLVGNIALRDKNPNAISFITIFYWMLTGKKDQYLNIFPKPGVSDSDIDGTKKFGEMVLPHLEAQNFDTLQNELINEKAVVIVYSLMTIEAKAKIIFRIWAKFIAKRKNKTAWLTVFKYYLFIALFIGGPLLLILDFIFIKPFSTKKIKRKKQYYLQVK